MNNNNKASYTEPPAIKKYAVIYDSTRVLTEVFSNDKGSLLEWPNGRRGFWTKYEIATTLQEL